jgi:hypothetical protein
MTDDLVASLRGYLEWREDWPSQKIPLVIDRIEQLEAALQWIIDVGPVFMRSADQHPSYCKCHRCAMDNARAIMEASNG